MKSSLLRRAVAAALLSSLALFSVGCGGSGGDTSGFNNAQGNPFQGNFSGSGALSNGQTGTLNLAVGPDGRATGTYLVRNAPVAMLANFSVAAGSYTVSGSVDPATGAFSLTGTVPDFGTFTITGFVPLGSSLGSYVVTINNQTFTGSIAAGAGSSPGGGPGAGSTRPILSGSLSGFVFTPGGGFNGVNPPVSSPLITGEITTGTSDNNHLVIGLAQTGSPITNIRALGFVVTTHGNPLTTGTYNILQNSSDTGFTVSLSDTTGTTINQAWAQTSGTSGTFTITSLSETQIEADFNVSNVGINAQQPGSAAGTFSTSGHIQANISSLTP
ncbi:hypothetical protein JST97_12850 [bacterium]|nr:hypothetical protein [bacterium]